MNKQKKTTLIKISLLFTFLLFLSCNDDLYNNHEHNHGENKNKITLSQFKSETKIKDFKTIIKSNIQAMKSTNRTAELSDFVIDTLAIQRHISQNSKTTYSFRIYPISGISLSNENYNLVYRLENNNWEQSIFLIKTNANLEFSEINHLYDSFLESNSVNLRAYTACISTTPVTYCTGQSVCADRCDATTSAGCPRGECYRYVITTIGDCSTGGGGSSDPNNGNPSDNSQSGYLPTNPYEFTPNMFDNPVYDDPNYVNAIKAQHFFSNLSYAQQVWANENVENYNQLIQYRIDNNWSDESEEFVEELIEGLEANPQPIYNSSDYPGDNEGMPFEWWNNKEFIIENLKMKDESNLLEKDPNEREILLFMAYPAQALLHIKNSNFALNTSVELVENGVLTRIHNGKADAFRHAYWNAFDTAQFGSYVTKLFTDAHEWNSANQPLESQMDFYNNQIGRNIGQDLSFYSTPELVKQTILNEITEGSLKYLTPLADHDGNNILPNTLIKFTNN